MPQAALVGSAVYYPPTNKIYVFGGSTRTPDPVVVYDVTRIYDIATNTWTTGATMPATRQQMASGYNPANGKIYLNGGFETSTIDSVPATTWEYDPVANTCTVKAPSPAMQAGTTAEVINGKLVTSRVVARIPTRCSPTPAPTTSRPTRGQPSTSWLTCRWRRTPRSRQSSRGSCIRSAARISPPSTG